MKKLMTIVAIVAVFGFAANPASARSSADWLAGWDLNATNNYTETDYAPIQGQGGVGNPSGGSVVSGGITLNVHNTWASLGYDFEPATGAVVPQLLRDYMHTDWSGVTYYTLSDLAPNTPYNLRFYHWRDNQGPGRLKLFQNTSKTAGGTELWEVINDFLNFPPGQDPDLVGWTDFAATSDGAGFIYLNDGHGTYPVHPDYANEYYTFNGFEVVSAAAPPEPPIPEPAGLGLVGLALLAMRRRRS